MRIVAGWKGIAVAGAAVLVSVVAAASAVAQCDAFALTDVPMAPEWESAEFEDVTDLGNGRAMAVGSYRIEPFRYQYETFTLAMYWDGASWSHVPTPSPAPYPGGSKAYLHAVAAVSPDDVWAAGDAVGDAGGESIGPWVLVEHFDGNEWSVIPSPPPPGGVSINFSGTRVHDIVAIASDDVWFGGQWGEPSPEFDVTWRPLAMRWNGSSLDVYPTPVIMSGPYGFKIVSMSALGPDDIWAACASLDGYRGSEMNVILRWDGSEWSRVPVPDTPGLHTLTRIVAIAPNDVWVFGERDLSYDPFALHFDGSEWRTVEISQRPVAAVATATGDVLVASDRIARIDGETTTVVEAFDGVRSPWVFSLDRFGDCGFWAVGRRLPATGGSFRPLAALSAGAGEPSAFSLSLVPRTTEARAGDVLLFDAELENVTGSAATGDVWLEAILPNGAPWRRNPIMLRRGFTLPAGAVARGVGRLRIPSRTAPSGPYVIAGRVGAFPDSTVTGATFYFTVVP